MAPIVYGIPNCDTVKKSRTWLADHGLQATFHDFKKQGLAEKDLEIWLAHLGWETLLNRKGSTWRKLDPALQASVNDASSAKAVMLAHTSCIKRPVIVWPSGQVTAGHTPDLWPA